MTMDYLLGNSVAILQIIWIDLLLSGDNAVVIALACRSLPPHLRKTGIVLGAGVAIFLRIVFAAVISHLLAIPLLKVAGGLLLLWIAVKLAKGEEAEERNITGSDKLYKAVWTIAVADAVMSLDNVVAIAAVSKGNPWLFGFGLALSIPLIMMGSQIIMRMIERFPMIVWAGAALLGWIAGEMIATDPRRHRPPRHRSAFECRLSGGARWRCSRGGDRLLAQVARRTRRHARKRTYIGDRSSQSEQSEEPECGKPLVALTAS
jgi:YjbE family integral membrane protein